MGKKNDKQAETEEFKKSQANQASADEPEAGEEESQKRGCLGKSFLLLGILFILLIIGALAAALEGWSRLLPVTQESSEIVVDIPSGAGVMEIGKILEKAGAIKSAKAFKYVVAYKKTGPKLKAGEQVVDPSHNTMEIMETLIKGNFKLYPVTVPEGLTMKDISVIVERAGFGNKDDFLNLCTNKEFVKGLGLEAKTLEGYLFPETYNFTRKATSEDVVRAMVKRFLTVWEKYSKKAEALPLNRHEIITLASIIEKETGAAEERPLIAAVFLNRLEKGMRLETDPTVIYGIKDFDGNLTKKHLKTPTPYNTYVIEGLPPGPIASPGEDSIKAVFEPAEVEYIFFVSKNDGTHKFSKTLREHNRAVTKYQKSLRKKKK